MSDDDGLVDAFRPPPGVYNAETERKQAAGSNAVDMSLLVAADAPRPRPAAWGRIGNPYALNPHTSKT